MLSTRNRMLALLPSVAGLMVVLQLAHAAEATTITADNPSPGVGQTFLVTVGLTSTAGFSCWGQVLKWDAATLRLVDMTTGNSALASPFGTVVTDSRTMAQINGSGEVRMGGYHAAAGPTYPDNAPATGAVAVFTFLRTAAGPTTLACPAKTDPIASGQPSNANDFGFVLIDHLGSARAPVSSSLVLGDPPADVAPVITAQPVSQSVVVGQPATFQVVATGDPAPTYQWLRNNSPIGGATGFSHTTPVTVPGDHGTVFSVVVTNRAGMQTSATATLSVRAVASPPAITSLTPSHGTVGVEYLYSCRATGSGPITWSISGGALPAGLTINPITGVIAGIPTTAGEATGIITAANGIDPAASQAFAMTIAPSVTRADVVSVQSNDEGSRCWGGGLVGILVATCAMIGLRRRRSSGD
jgi:hypothetical protein